MQWGTQRGLASGGDRQAGKLESPTSGLEASASQKPHAVWHSHESHVWQGVLRQQRRRDDVAGLDAGARNLLFASFHAGHRSPRQWHRAAWTSLRVGAASCGLAAGIAWQDVEELGTQRREHHSCCWRTHSGATRPCAWRVGSKGMAVTDAAKQPR